MKTVSLQDLKNRLSSLVAEAASGIRVLITRHRRPIAMLAPPAIPAVRVGSRFGRGQLEPLLDHATHGRYLAVLAEDRREGE